MRFGTSGLRGLAAEMTDAACAAHVAAFLAHLANGGARPTEALVGRDLRDSSPRIAAACGVAIRAAGLASVDCGVLPTPALALEALRRGAPAIMVTGSHIPPDRNGLKFYTEKGEISKEDETGILAALSTPESSAATPGPERAAPEAAARYVARAVAGFPPGALSGSSSPLLQARQYPVHGATQVLCLVGDRHATLLGARLGALALARHHEDALHPGVARQLEIGDLVAHHE